jgi:hypothetical protein
MVSVISYKLYKILISFKNKVLKINGASIYIKNYQNKKIIIHCLCNTGSLLSVFIQKCTLYTHTMYIHAKNNLYTSPVKRT